MNPIELASHGPVIPVIVIDRHKDRTPGADGAARSSPAACACSK